MLPHLTQTAPAQSVYRPSEPRPVPFQGAPVFQKLKAGPKPPLFAGSPPEKQSFWQTISTYAQQFWRFVKSAFSKVFSAFSRNTPAKPKSSQPSATKQPQPPTADLQQQDNNNQNQPRPTMEVIHPSVDDDFALADKLQIEEVLEHSRTTSRAEKDDRRLQAESENSSSTTPLSTTVDAEQQNNNRTVARQLTRSGGIPYSVRWASNLPVTPLPTQYLFGENLKSIHFTQNNRSTCHLLVALNSIFQHPQGQKILDLIKINRIQNGYEVNFPGQPELITVLDSELVRYGRSRAPGVYILEQAYLNIGPKPPVSDTTHNALVKMLGENHVLSGESIGNALTEMFGEENVKSNNVSVGDLLSASDSFVSILTGLNKNQAGHDPYHYSITPNPEQPDQFNVFNFFDRSKNRLSVLTRDQLNKEFSIEDNLIRLNPPLTN